MCCLSESTTASYPFVCSRLVLLRALIFQYMFYSLETFTLFGDGSYRYDYVYYRCNHLRVILEIHIILWVRALCGIILQYLDSEGFA